METNKTFRPSISGILYTSGISLFYLLLIYIFFSSNPHLMKQLIQVQIVIILVCCTPLMDIFMTMYFGYRRVLTEEEREHLLTPYYEVKEQIEIMSGKKQFIPFKVHVDDDMSINACAYGIRSIAINRGSIYAFSPDELKGVIAHEMGHLFHGDSITGCIIVFGNIALFTLTFIMGIVQVIMEITGFIVGNDDLHHFSRFIRWLFTTIKKICLYTFQCLNSFYQRQREFAADKFAFDIGYGEELRQALITISKSDLSVLPLHERIIMSHPRIQSRIYRLEQYLGY